MATRPYIPNQPGVAPLECCGKWVAWNAERTQVLATGATFAELWKIVQERKVIKPIFAKIPRADQLFIGRL